MQSSQRELNQNLIPIKLYSLCTFFVNYLSIINTCYSDTIQLKNNFSSH